MRPPFLFVALSMLPDADVIAFWVGIPYAAQFGHRGASHSLIVAAAIGILTALIARTRPERRVRLGLLAAAVVASHGLLDALTDGGLGVALLWPFDLTRFFASWTPIPVSPIGRGLFTMRGLEVIVTELVYFAPLLIWGAWPILRSLREKVRSSPRGG